MGANWAPDCTLALPAPALRRGSQPRLTTWPLLCPHPSMIAPPVVGAGLAEDNNEQFDTTHGGSWGGGGGYMGTSVGPWTRLYCIKGGRMTFQVYICENPDGFGLLSSVIQRRL